MRISDWSSDVCSSDVCSSDLLLKQPFRPNKRIGLRCYVPEASISLPDSPVVILIGVDRRPKLELIRRLDKRILPEYCHSGEMARVPRFGTWLPGFFTEHLDHLIPICPIVCHAQMSRPIKVVTYRVRSEEHTSELQSLMRISYAVFCLKKTKHK